MKKKTAIMIAAVLLACIAAGCACAYVGNLPEYTLSRMAEGIRTEGIEAIEPYLGSNLKEIFGAVKSVINHPLARLASGTDAGMRILQMLEQGTDWEWEMRDICHGADSAVITLDIRGNGFSGAVGLNMQRIGGKWFLEDISVPAAGWIL